MISLKYIIQGVQNETIQDEKSHSSHESVFWYCRSKDDAPG
jgi:hypothetical protein